jgi:4,5-DOPA dioxygenase extradiol
MSTRLPSVFVSHGSPEFALHPGRIGRRLRQLGQWLPRPEAVLMVSAHWQTEQVQVSVDEHPETIHDFRGFDPALYRIGYPVRGHPGLAGRVLEQLDRHGWKASPAIRGLDHGAWVPLLYLYPDASVPVFQVSLPRELDGESSLQFGHALSALSAEGLLVVGSGSLTHSLADFFGHKCDGEVAALAFRDWIRRALAEQRYEDLANALEQAPHARRAHPTPEHFLPLLVAAGASGEHPRAHLIEGEMIEGVLAMDAVVFTDPTARDQPDFSSLDF